ncbi:O-acetyltransferase OatA [Porphyridium purpureum]|uniref:O-acetyltransferase OatA n=1 Tax=Porphyridium purpureum TaxID=35688 RepID=A0A5J4Z567_PORPP|nr:O-acetyltransferase OatA [Porphyridium purpureum]|eukprot:POR5194..scf295_1
MSADEMLLPATPTTASKASRGRGIVVRTLEYFVDSDVPPHWLPHLDGLRAIALLGVLLYHFELLACLGGFTGVDVFLVLSGFLMTRNIMKKIATDSFVLSEFYKGRFWRLYPSSLFTTTLTMMLAYFIFSPTLAYDTVRSGFSSMLLSSNILFSTEVGGYFDKSVILKPLLHTWSLSLEEQYYLFWPLFLIVTASLQKPVLEPWFVVIVAGLSLISFVLACVLVYPMATFSWYMLPTRIYEFTIGCLVHVFFPRMTSWPRMLQNSLCSLGLLGILWSYFFLDDNTRFPGWASIPSTVGAALIILSPNSHISRLFLCNKALRWLGKISYAAYLVHWPLWVYCCYITDSRAHGVWLFGLTLVLAYAQLHLFETPMREAKQPKLRMIAFIALACSAVFLVTSGLYSNGWSFRLVSPNLAHGGSIGKATDLSAGAPAHSSGVEQDTKRTGLNGAAVSTESVVAQVDRHGLPEELCSAFESVKDFPSSLFHHTRYQGNPLLLENGGISEWISTPPEQLASTLVTIGSFKDRRPTAIFLGDSFMGNLIPSFNILARDRDVYFAGVIASGCFTLFSESEDRQEIYMSSKKNGREDCMAWTRTAQRLVEDLKFKTTFLLVYRWGSSPYHHSLKHAKNGTDAFQEGLTSMVSYILDQGHKVVLVGAPPNPTKNPQECLDRRGTLAFGSEPCDSWASPDLAAARANFVMSELVQAPQFKDRVSLLNMFSLLCRRKNECRQIGLRDRALYRDNVGHMTIYGGLAYTNPLGDSLLRFS